MQDFEDGIDRIQIFGVTSIDQLMFFDTGPDVHILYGAGTAISVLNTAPQQFTSADFIFG